MKIISANAFLVAALSLFAVLQVQAAAPRDQGGEALRKAQYMLQKLSAEKNALEQDRLRLEEELKQMRSKLAEAQGKLDESEKSRSSTRAHNIALTNRMQAYSEQLAELQTTHRRMLADARADIELLRSAVQERDRWIADCQAKNEAMYQANSELLAAYRDKGVWDALAQREPVTGIASVEVERMEQEYRFRLEDLRTVEFESAGPATP